MFGRCCLYCMKGLTFEGEINLHQDLGLNIDLKYIGCFTDSQV